MKSLRIAAALFVAPILFAAFTACGETETEWVNAPVVSATQAAVTVSDEGGTVTAALTVQNPTSDGTISAAASASWLTVESCTTSAVTLTAAANVNADPRTARVTVTYSYTVAGSKGSSTCEVTVAQGTGDQPSLSVQPTAIAADRDGGSYSLSYTLTNPSASGTLSASCDATWVTDLGEPSDGTVGFTVQPNPGTLRQTTITLSYSWDGGTTSDSVTVVQDHQGDTGDGGFDGNIEGTYTITGISYYSYPYSSSWTVTVHYAPNSAYTDSEYPYLIDGLLYAEVGDYSGGYQEYCAKAKVEGNNIIVPAQITQGSYYLDETRTSEAYLGYAAGYLGSDGYVYVYDGYPDIVFTYNEASNSWSCNYGILGLLFDRLNDFSSFDEYMIDLTVGDITLVKNGSGGSADLSEFVGTYSCDGYSYNFNYNGYNDYSAHSTWTMKIYDHGDGRLLLSGLVPDTVDYYPYPGSTADNGPYTAYATVSGDNIIVSYPQWTGWNTTSDNTGQTAYICWVMCPEEGYFSSVSGNITFRYSSGTWTSDDGLWLALNANTTAITETSLVGFYNFFLPGMSFTKTSSSTSVSAAAQSSLKSLEEREQHTGAKFAPTPASDGRFNVRKAGTRTQR